MKIIVNGAKGKMGQVVCKTLLANKAFTLVAQTNSTKDLNIALKQNSADIAIDFTTPQSVYENTKTIIESNVRPVIGTTGLKTEQIKSLKEMCDKIKLGGIIAPNFSLGAIFMIKCAALIGKQFEKAEIIELHNHNKLDKPSGTALKTAEVIADTRKTNNSQTLDQDIPIHSIRLPGILANQEVIFGGLGETLSIKHETIDRNCFMEGLLFACKKVMTLNTLHNSLETLL